MWRARAEPARTTAKSGRRVSVGRDAFRPRSADRTAVRQWRWRHRASLRLAHDRRSSRARARPSSRAGSGRTMRRAPRGLGAYAIDVGSSVDASPGVKSRGTIRALFEALRPAAREGAARNAPDGRFGRFGGVLCARNPGARARAARSGVSRSQEDPAFAAELGGLLADYAGRPTPLTRCRNLPGNIYLKREDLLHGGAHKTNQVLAQGLLAKRMGKTRLIAETGAGQHGVATAMVGALLGLRDPHLHGRARRRAAGAQRLPDAADGRRGGARSKAAARASRTPSTRRCATGRRASQTPIICSAPPPARIPSR